MDDPLGGAGVTASAKVFLWVLIPILMDDPLGVVDNIGTIDFTKS